MKWLHRPEDATKLIALISYSLVLIVVGMFFGWRSVTANKDKAVIELANGYVAFDPKHMVCDVFDMKASGWTMVMENDQKHNRLALQELAINGMAEFREADTLKCRQRDAQGLKDKIEFSLRQEWYVLNKLPGRRLRSGD